MTAIALVTAARVAVVGIPIQQLTAPAVEAIVAGAPVRLDTATGKFTNSNGTTAPEARVWGIATRSAAAGEAVTAIRRGLLDGYDLSGLAYDAPVYLSDTDGRLDTAAGTVSTPIGRVVPGTSVTTVTAYDKILSVEL